MFGVVTNRQILQALADLTVKVDILMTEQAGIDAAAQEIQADVTRENTALAAIQAEIATLQAGNPALDLSGLQAAVGQLDQATAAEQAAVPPPA
jgi:hypothetical protein